MNKFGVIFIFILFWSYAKSDETEKPVDSFDLPTSSATETTSNESSGGEYETRSTLSVSTSDNFTCSDRYRYSMPLIEFTKDISFMFPLILLLCEIFGLLILRGILAFYVLRRRLKKIYIFTHPPVLGEEYFADPPPYATQQQQN